MGLSEVTLTLVDPDLVEAAEFVLGSGAGEAAAGPVAVPDSAFGGSAEGFNAEDTEGADQTEENLSPAGEEETPGEPLAGTTHGEPAFLKKRRATEKPSMNLKPGEVVVRPAAIPLGTERVPHQWASGAAS